MWSRIIDIEDPLLETGDGFDLDDDIEKLDVEQVQVPKRNKKKWKPLFHPKSHWVQQENRDLESNIIGKRKLRAYAKDATDKRKLFIQRAIALVDEQREPIYAGNRTAD